VRERTLPPTVPRTTFVCAMTTEVSVSLLQFLDDDGRQWQVWDTRPTAPVAKVGSPSVDAAESPSDKATEFPLLSRKREAGWLTFTAADERRRLSPIPDAWELADETSLRAFLKTADKIVGKDANLAP